MSDDTPQYFDHRRLQEVEGKRCFVCDGCHTPIENDNSAVLIITKDKNFEQNKLFHKNVRHKKCKFTPDV